VLDHRTFVSCTPSTEVKLFALLTDFIIQRFFPTMRTVSKKKRKEPGMVAQASNPSYSRGRDGEHDSGRPAWAKS
jgi:hypothetical protein